MPRNGPNGCFNVKTTVKSSGASIFSTCTVLLRARMGLLEHVDREQYVGRRERLAVMPGHARLELEGVDLGVLADRPAFGEAGQRLQLRAVTQQAFKDVDG